MSNNPRSGRGRQAEAARNDQRLLDAARDVVAMHGADAPVSLIAEAAGIGVGSIYRRYSSKTELLQHLCLLAMRQTISAAEAGLAQSDPWNGLQGYIRDCIAFRSGALAPLAGHIPTTAEMRDHAARSLDLLEKLVERAPVRADVTAIDIAWLIEQFGRSPAFELSADDAHVRDRLLAIALDGLRSGMQTALPGPPPTREQYTRRWH
jgi:AcrR family transcriptional regulator